MKTALFDIDNWKEIAATLSRNKTRTFMTAFGIFWGTAMLAILMGGAQGAKDIIGRNFDGFATNTAGMFPGRTTLAYHGHQKGRSWQLDMTDVKRLQLGIPELKAVTALSESNNISLKHGKYSCSSTIGGADENYAMIMVPTIYAGRFINMADVENQRKVAVVGKKIASQLFPGIPSPIGEIIELNGISYIVVGIMGQTNEVQMNGNKLDDQVLIPSSTFRKAFNRGDNVDGLLFVAHDKYKIKDLIPFVRRLVYQRHDISPDDEHAMFVFDISEMFEMADNLFTGLSLLALFIGISTLMAGIIGIGNIMWVIVKERTQEIGVRRALGAKPRDIITQILSEGVTLTTIAGLAGITFAVVTLGITQHLTTNEVSVPHFQLSLIQAIGITVIFGVLGTIAGLLPARKAMKIKPIEALNDK